jgi:hypothetical protein
MRTPTMRLRLAVATIPLIAAAACGTAATTSTAPAPTAPATETQRTADQIGKALKAHGLPVQAITVYDGNTDPNHILGRPGGYTSKIDFADPAVKKNGPAGGGKDVGRGGSIEVFSDPADASKRGAYIQTITQNMQILGREYNFVSGAVLLRLSGDLPPSHAAKYAKALLAIVGQPIVTPKPVRT